MVKMKAVKYILIIITLLFYGSNIDAATKKAEVTPIKAEIEFAKTTVYPGEIVMATLMLTCVDTELGYIRNVPSLSSNKGLFDKEISINVTGAPTISQQDNKIVRKYPIAQYAVSFNSLGKNEISSEDVIVGINHPVIQNHPFWGAIQSYETEERQLKFKPINIEVKKLPDNKEKLPYSGAIGNFEVNTIVPDAQFVVNETGIIYIVIEGEGILPEEILPEYTEAFGENVKLKSISSSSRTFYKGGKLMSNRTWECEIVPKTVGKNRVGSISLGFFNTETGKYEIAESKPVEIEVESSTVRREMLDI